MSSHVVDLTLDSDSDSEERARKRRRCQSAGGRRAPASAESDDGDVVVIEPARERPPRPRPSAGDMDLGDEDLVITGGIGQVVTRDMAHPRPDCAEHRFTTSASTSNAAYCPQCFCFVCDVKASDCQYWGTGARERDHANSRPIGYWRRLREAARVPGNSGLINSEYRASGPLGSGMQPRLLQQARLPFPAAGTKRLSSGLAAEAAAGSDPSRQAGVDAAGQQAQLATTGQSNAAAGLASAPNQLATMAAEAAALNSVPTAPAAAPNPAPTAAAPATARNPTPTAAATPAAPAQVAAKVAPATPSACKLRPLPDPSKDRLAFELGVLRFGVKAVRGLTIAELAGRLQRFGFYFKSSARQEDWSDRLALDNLFDSCFGLYGGKYKSKATHLKMLPLPPPPEEAVPVPPERIRKVLVVDCLGRTRATLMGVRVPQMTKRADLLASLAPMLRPLFSASSELLHLVHFASFEANTVKPVEPNVALDDSFFSTPFCTTDDGPQLVVYRTSHHPAPTWTDTHAASLVASSSEPQPKWTEMPTYGHCGGGGSPSTALHGAVPAWVVVQIRLFSPPPGLAESSAQRYTLSTTRLSASLLVPLRKEHAKGGPEAQRELNGALLRGLQPYRTPSALSPAHASPAIVVRGNRSYMTDRPTQTSGARWGLQGDSVGTFAPGSSLPQLTAVFAHDLPATSYRLDEMRSPAVDASSSPDAMRESAANIAETKKREASCRKRKELPAACITELVATSRRPLPDDKASIVNLGTGGWCKVATDAVLLPSSRPGATPREGELVIKVYAWTSGMLGRTSLFQPWDEWPSISKRDGSLRFPLQKTMELLTTGAADPEEHTLLAAEAAAAAGGPSTSNGSSAFAAAAAGSSSSTLSAAGSAELQVRVRAERRRARVMVASAKELDACAYRYRSINTLLEFMQSGERPAVAQPAGLTVELRPYQLQSVAFMLDLERLVDTTSAAGGGAAGPSTSAGSAGAEIDPADAPDGGCPGGYRRLFWLPITNTQGRRYWYSPVFERLTMEVPAQPIGGFLAEEMGLGKTVEVMALTLANPPPPSLVAGATLPCGSIASCATLVVCAVSLVGQWQAEAQNKTSGSCRIHPYHGSSRIRDPKRLASEFDVVVTTYQTLQSDHASGTKDPCQQIKWHRIVFDEGHTLRNASSKLAKTALELKADRKWLCTGTPINNAVDDLLGQFAAIHLLPLGRKPFFDSYIKCPFQGNARFDSLNSAPLLYALRHTMIRHTKAQNLGGEGVLQLPKKTETDVPVFLSAQEQELYRKVHKEALRGWQKLKAAGVAFVNSHLFTATSMLMPLRRICSGGLMRPQDLAVPDPERLNAVAGANGGGGGAAAGGAAGAAATMTDNTEVPIPEDVSECPICVDSLEQPVVTRCNHWFCRECLTGWINSSAHHNCPACRQAVTVASLRRGVVAQSQTAPQPAAEDSDDDADDDTPSDDDDGVLCASKLRVLLAELRAMREADPKAKALVFTQFGQTLEWLKPRLIEEGFGHRTITGDMTQKRRTEAIDSFQRDPKTSVFLLSVRSGAVGINLTAANYVFLLEPCMNPAMEEQAIGRAWRMGQQRPVVVKRFFVKGSVEERIREVVKTRRAATGDDSESDSDSDGAGPSTAARIPTAVRGRGARGAVVAGSLRQDKTDLRINELELMFREPEFPPPGAAGAEVGQQ